MGTFDRFVKVVSKRELDITVLPETNNDPAFVVQARVISDKEQNEASERYLEGQSINWKKFRPWWGRRVVIGWSGLTANNIRRMIPNADVDDDKIEQTYAGGEIPYSADLAADLHLNAPVDAFAGLINRALDEERQRLRDEASGGTETKNS